MLVIVAPIRYPSSSRFGLGSTSMTVVAASSVGLSAAVSESRKIWLTPVELLSLEHGPHPPPRRPGAISARCATIPAARARRDRHHCSSRDRTAGAGPAASSDPDDAGDASPRLPGPAPAGAPVRPRYSRDIMATASRSRST